jgi:hypothetical protein
MPKSELCVAFYAWLAIIEELEGLSESEFYQIEKDYWGMYYELAIENM